MQWELIVALVIAIPVILFPAAYVWYLNVGGIVAAIKKARAALVTSKGSARLDVEISQEQEYGSALTDALKRYPWLTNENTVKNVNIGQES